MAQLYFDHLCEKENISEITAYSAGVCAYEGGRASAPVFMLMQSLNIDASRFRSRRLDSYMVADADLIIAMSEEHRQAIIAIDESAAEKTKMITDFLPQGTDATTMNPYGSGLEIYTNVFESMRPAIENIFAFCKRAASGS
jgi:protein-tyrosine-phosphatase